MPAPLLSASLLRQLDQLELLARRRSRSTARGERQSRARGHSVEFADYRNYVAGDDLRYLDWNLYGRLDRLFVKLHEEERELPVQIFLDASESMNFGSPTKFDFARRIAAALGYVALCGFDRVTVRVFPERPGAPGGPGGLPPERRPATKLHGLRGRRSAGGFFEQLAGLVPGGAADFNQALRRGAVEIRQTGVAIVLSDLLDPQGCEPGLAALVARGLHVHVVQILAPEEWQPVTFGDLRLVDSETAAEQPVTFGRFRLNAYRAVVENHLHTLRTFCHRRGIGFFPTTSDTALESLLLRELRIGAVLG